MSETLFLQSYLPGMWNHTWSLAVEEHFYLMLPLLLATILAFNRRDPLPFRPVLGVAVAIAVFALAMRVLNGYWRPSYNHLTHLYATHLRLDSLVCGVAIAYAYHFHHDEFRRLLGPWRRVLVVGGMMLLAPAFLFPLERSPLISTIGLSVFYLGSGMVLVGTLLSSLPPNRAVAALAVLGSFSYSIYLWHIPVLYWGIAIAEWICATRLEFWGRLGVYFGGSFLVGIAMAMAVESPVLRLRDKWFPSSGVVDAGAAAEPVTQNDSAVCGTSGCGL